MPSPAQRNKKQRVALFERIQDAAKELAGGTFPDDLAGLRRDVVILAPAELESQLQLIKNGIPAADWDKIAPDIAAFIKSAGLPVPAILSTEILGPQTPAAPASAPCLFCGRQVCDTIFVPGTALVPPGFEHVRDDGNRYMGPSPTCLEEMRNR